ncbi:hypothetical protein RDI58_010925 [Solanum bulbocastanum]|uniref:Uncharacterized protein n=1 Tax=Solanum bulbocastanum TaxID=147425 RepID=A0AAN8YFT7_SOLBU
MKIKDLEDIVIIFGRYPSSFTSNGHAIFSLTCISNDDSLSSFLRSFETFSNCIYMQMLEMPNECEGPITQLSEVVHINDDELHDVNVCQHLQDDSMEDNESEDDDEDVDVDIAPTVVSIVSSSLKSFNSWIKRKILEMNLGLTFLITLHYGMKRILKTSSQV